MQLIFAFVSKRIKPKSPTSNLAVNLTMTSKDDPLAGLRRARELWQQQQLQRAATAASSSSGASASPTARRGRLASSKEGMGLRLNPNAALVETPANPSDRGTSRGGRGAKRARSSNTAVRRTRRASSRSTKRKGTKSRGRRTNGTRDGDLTDDEPAVPVAPEVERSLIAEHEFSWRVVKGRRTLFVSRHPSSSLRQITHPVVLRAAKGVRGETVVIEGHSAHAFWERVKRARVAHPEATVAQAIHATHSLVGSQPASRLFGALGAVPLQTTAFSTQASSPGPAAQRMLSAMKQRHTAVYAPQQPPNFAGVKREPAVKQERNLPAASREGSAGSTVSSTTMRLIEEVDRRTAAARPSFPASQRLEVIELSDDEMCAEPSISEDSDSSSSMSDSTSVTSSTTLSSSSSEDDAPVLPHRCDVTHASTTSGIAIQRELIPQDRRHRPGGDGGLLSLASGGLRPHVDPRQAHFARSGAVARNGYVDDDGTRFVDAQDQDLLEATGFADSFNEGF